MLLLCDVFVLPHTVFYWFVVCTPFWKGHFQLSWCESSFGVFATWPSFFFHTLLKHDSAHAIHMNRILGVFGMWAWSRLLSVIAPFHWAALTRFLELTGCLSCLGAKCQKMQPVTEFQMASFQTTCSGTMVMSGQWLTATTDKITFLYHVWPFFKIYLCSLSLCDPVPLTFDRWLHQLPLLEYFVLNAFCPSQTNDHNHAEI